jgi:hypothetical protein
VGVEVVVEVFTGRPREFRFIGVAAEVIARPPPANNAVTAANTPARTTLLYLNDDSLGRGR